MAIAFATFNAGILWPSVILWPSWLGLQLGYSVSEWLRALFASLLAWCCAWGRLAEGRFCAMILSLDSPMGFRLVLYDVTHI
jgi:hypothetical protein